MYVGEKSHFLKKLGCILRRNKYFDRKHRLFTYFFTMYLQVIGTYGYDGSTKFVGTTPFQIPYATSLAISKHRAQHMGFHSTLFVVVGEMYGYIKHLKQ